MRELKINKRITIRDEKCLEKYFNDIGRIDLLTPEEEVELAQRIKDGDDEALESLVKSNLRFVASVAKQYQGQGLPLSDLINEGNLGLIKAALNFDETKGFRFISYAVWWIRQSILRALESYARTVRLPANKVEAINKVNRLTKQLEQEFERTPTHEELAELLEIKEKDIKDAMNSNKHISIDAPMNGDEENESRIGDAIKNEKAEKPEGKLLDESLKNEIRRLLSQLKPREAKIITYTFGLDGNGCKSPHEIGQIIDLSRERVRQIRLKALRKLRKKASNSILKTYL